MFSFMGFVLPDNFYRATLWCYLGICCRHVSVCLSVPLSVRHKPALYRNG